MNWRITCWKSAANRNPICKLPSNYKQINGTHADTDSNYTRIQIIRNRNVVIQQEEVQQLFQLGTNSAQLRGGGAEQLTYIKLWKNLSIPIPV